MSTDVDIHVYMYIYMQVYIRTDIHIHIYSHAYMHTRMHVNMLYTCIGICMYLYMYAMKAEVCAVLGDLLKHQGVNLSRQLRADVREEMQSFFTSERIAGGSPKCARCIRPGAPRAVVRPGTGQCLRHGRTGRP